MVPIAALAAISRTEAAEQQAVCAKTASILSESRHYESFDRKHAGGDRRLRFRLDGREPCLENECSLAIIYSSPDSHDKTVASINLSHRDVSFCVEEPAVIETPAPARRQDCPTTFLLNALSINLKNEFGQLSGQQVNVAYLYRGAGRGAPLDECTWPDDSYGRLRQTIWTVPFDDGAAVNIYELDYPKGGQRFVPDGAPLAVTVFGAKN